MKQTVLITGASDGIGLECAKVFAAHRFDLVLTARRTKRLIHLKNWLERKYDITVIVIPMDLTKDEAAEELWKKTRGLGIRINILVNNAGFGDYGSYLGADWKKQKDMITVNINSLMQLTYLFGNDMCKHGYARILNLSSAAAFAAGPMMAVYYASKGFILSFSQAVAEELKGSGVTVTAFCPGPIRTGFETAAGMKSPKMYWLLPVASPRKAAEAGCRACMQGKTVKYYSLTTQVLNIASRISPRWSTRKTARQINEPCDKSQGLSLLIRK